MSTPAKSSHSSSSSSSSHSSTSHQSSSSVESQTPVRQHVHENVVTEIRGHTQPIAVSGKAEVFVKTEESWDYAALQKLEEKIAVERAAIIDAEKLFNDQSTLYREALQTKEVRISDAHKLESLVTEKASERDRWLNEEKELEVRRAAAHAKAVELESLRTDALAQAVLAKEEAKVSDSLALQRSEGIKQAQAIVDAHRLAIQKLEEHRIQLRTKELDVSVKSEALPQPKAVDINVTVKPLDLPEARIVSQAVVRGAGAQSHMQENIPTHQKTVVEAGQVQVAAHAEQTKVERHVVSTKDKVVL